MELTDCKVEYVLASSSGAEEGPQVHLTFARPDAAGGAGAGPSGASGGAGAPAGAGAGAGAWGSAGGRGAGAGTLTVRPVEKVTVCADKFNLLLYELKVRVSLFRVSATCALARSRVGPRQALYFGCIPSWYSLYMWRSCSTAGCEGSDAAGLATTRVTAAWPCGLDGSERPLRQASGASFYLP